MKSKVVILLALFCLPTIFLAAQAPEVKLSLGGGVYFDVGVPMWDASEGAVIGVGGYGFFDFTYAEVDVGIGYYRLTDAEIYGAALNLGVLLRYPFDFGNFAIFPLLGARFTIPLTQSYDGNSVDGFNTSDNIRLGLQGGFGMDFPLNNSWYLRASALANFDFFAPGEDPGDDTLYSISPMIKVGIGYKF